MIGECQTYGDLGCKNTSLCQKIGIGGNIRLSLQLLLLLFANLQLLYLENKVNPPVYCKL